MEEGGHEEAQMLQEHQMLQNQMDEMNEEEYKQQQL